MKSNRKSLLTASLACIIGALLIYTFKWVKMYFLSGSVWKVAQIFGEMGRYINDGYKVISILIYSGAIVSIALLIWNAYRIAKPLIDGTGWVEEARSTKSGMIASVVFTVLFIIFVWSSNTDDMSDASITLWPVIEIALCIVSKVLLTKMDYGNEESSTNYSSVVVSRDDTSGKKLEPDNRMTIEKQSEKDDRSIIIPITNYDPNCMIQPSQIIFSTETGKTALVITCYSDYHILEALQIAFEFVDVFGDVIYSGKCFFLEFNAIDNGKITIIQTESIDIPELSKHIREIRSARATISRIKTTDGSIQLPETYKESTLGFKELSDLKGKGKNRDAVCQRSIDKNAWTCVCGHVNNAVIGSCQRCHRSQNNNKEELLDEIARAEDWSSLLELLDERIEGGMDELKAVKEKCMAYRAYSGLSGIKKEMQEMINKLLE